MRKSAHTFPTLDDSWLELLASSSDEWAVAFPSHIAEAGALFNLASGHEYKWHFTSRDYLFKQILDAEIANLGAAYINTLYWSDLNETIFAIREIFNRKLEVLISSSIWLLNRQDILSAACTARSAFELSMWALYNSMKVRSAVLAACEINGSDNERILHSELQTLLVKLTWGTRLLKDKGDERQQLNITTSCLKPLAEYIKTKSGEEYIEQAYDYLCELVHPNQIGNMLFVHAPFSEEESLQEIPIAHAQHGLIASMSVEKICGALSWTSKAALLMNEHIDVAAASLKKRFGVTSRLTH